MPRVVQLTVPSAATDRLLEEIRPLAGVVGVQVQRAASLQPPGDVVTVQSATPALPALMRLLDARPEISIATSEPISLVSAPHAAHLLRESSEASWEEMEQLIAKESNATTNALLVMACAGAFAAVGIATDALHLVVAGMLVAPGFEPLARISLGAAAGGRSVRRGLIDTAKGYLALLAGALLAAIVLRLLGRSLLGGSPSPLIAGSLVDYWTSFSASSLLVSALAAAAGGLLIAANRTLLTAGVMVALSLVPSASLVSVGVVSGEPDVILRGVLRWLGDAVLVVVLCWAVFAWQKARIHRRRMRF